MPRTSVLRPTISMRDKLRVLLRQLGEMWPDEYLAIADEQQAIGGFVEEKKNQLAMLLGCDASDLRLVFEPPLKTRRKVFDKYGKPVGYSPAADDPEYLNYRPPRRAPATPTLKTNPERNRP